MDTDGKWLHRSSDPSHGLFLSLPELIHQAAAFKQRENFMGALHVQLRHEPPSVKHMVAEVINKK